MSTLSSYTELIELLVPSLMRAYNPNEQPVLGTYWGYCLRCCRTVRAVFSPGKEEPECLRAEGASNQHILASEWKMKQLGEQTDYQTGHLLRKVYVQDSESYDKHEAVVLGYDDQQSDYYQTYKGHVRLNNQASPV